MGQWTDQLRRTVTHIDNSKNQIRAQFLIGMTLVRGPLTSVMGDSLAIN